MKIGYTVNTPHGIGRIVGVDLPLSKNKRFIVQLDKPHFDTNPAYNIKEIKRQKRNYMVWLKGDVDLSYPDNVSGEEFLIAESVMTLGEISFDFVENLIGRQPNNAEIMHLKKLGIIKVVNK